MSLFENPIFLTQKRLVHRAGVLVGIMLAALIGFCFISGMVAYLAGASEFHFFSPNEAGRIFYGWVLAAEILVLPIFGLARITRSLNDDRKSGMWESNRMTPLPPAQLVLGYWLGAPLREYYMGAVLAIVGLLIVLLGGLPLTFWLGTQVLVLSTTLLLGLLGFVASIGSRRGEGAVLLLVISIVLIPISFSLPSLLLTNFLLPSFGIVNLFTENSDNFTVSQVNPAPTLYGLALPPIFFTLAMQFVVGLFVWRAATSKVAKPFEPPLLRWEAIALFGLLVAAQHGLMWGEVKGQFPSLESSNNYDNFGTAMGMTQIGEMLLGAALLGCLCPPPERVRLEALRRGAGSLRLVYSRSAMSLAIALAAVGGICLASQFMYAFAASWVIYVVALLNFTAFFLIVAFLLEFCRVRFRQRASGFFGLGMLILTILPFILAGVLSLSEVGEGSLFSPGVLALSDWSHTNLNTLLIIDMVHLAIAGILFVAWQSEWKRLLEEAAPTPVVSPPPPLAPEAG